jgi:hypothetical protein
VRDENPLCFKPEFISGSKKHKIAANSPTQSGEEERRSQLQVTQMPIRTAEIHKKSATVDLHHKERI